MVICVQYALGRGCIRIFQKNFWTDRIRYLLLVYCHIHDCCVFFSYGSNQGFLDGSAQFMAWFCGVRGAGLAVSSFFAVGFDRTKKLAKERTRHRAYRILFGLTLVVSAAAINLYGMIHARQTETEYYQVSIEKDGGNLEDLRIAMVADLHLGYNIGYSEIQTMVNIINEENVDIVLICGDIFDNDFDAISNPEGIQDLLRSIKSLIRGVCLLWKS